MHNSKEIGNIEGLFVLTLITYLSVQFYSGSFYIQIMEV